MPDNDDIALLTQYAGGDESAFTVLVERYVNLVYSTALRQVCNPSHAEEITQAVFIFLTKKAKSISPMTILSGWLYQTARLTAANFQRSEYRRQQREQEAYMQSTLTECIKVVGWLKRHGSENTKACPKFVSANIIGKCRSLMTSRC
jgi:DNA-directed RNA polymerase specialized sigma24 family protein